MQNGLSLSNPQFAFSLVVFVTILINLKTEKPRHGIVSLLVALALGLKFYAGIVSFFLVTIFYTQTLLKTRNVSTYLNGVILLFLYSGIVFFIFYNPFEVAKSGAGLIFQPFATTHQMIDDQDLLNLQDTVNARYFLQESVAQTGKISPRLIWIEAMTIGLFIFFNLGTRIIGIFYLAKLPRPDIGVNKEKITRIESIIGKFDLEKLKANLQEVSARGGRLIVFADPASGIAETDNMRVLHVAATEKAVSPIIYTIPMQLLAYHVAVIKGTDIDQPRNLAKSVTVE